jgi:hypothetical protein
MNRGRLDLIMLYVRRFVIAALLVLGGCVSLFAQFPINTQKPAEDTAPTQVRELVAKYCRLDYDGARLDPQAWPKFEPLVWWTSAPQYTQIDVIARYSVDTEPVATKNKYSVSVHYRLLGTYDLVNGYVPEPSGAMQNVDFLVTMENTQWKIGDSENTLPHPSRAGMLKWLNEKLASTDDAAAKERYQQALTQIQAQPASPFVK